MTSIEAENQYECEMTKCFEQHKNRLQNEMIVCIIISLLLIVIGIVLTIIGCNAPPEINIFGDEIESLSAMLEKIFGISILCAGVLIMLIIFPQLYISYKKGPENILPQIKNLYLNYLKCEDIGEDDKEFYKQKLEEIRNMELVNAIRRASVTASAAVMFNALHK